MLIKLKKKICKIYILKDLIRQTVFVKSKYDLLFEMIFYDF